MKPRRACPTSGCLDGEELVLNIPTCLGTADDPRADADARRPELHGLREGARGRHLPRQPGSQRRLSPGPPLCRCARLRRRRAQHPAPDGPGSTGLRAVRQLSLAGGSRRLRLLVSHGAQRPAGDHGALPGHGRIDGRRHVVRGHRRLAGGHHLCLAARISVRSPPTARRYVGCCRPPSAWSSRAGTSATSSGSCTCSTCRHTCPRGWWRGRQARWR